MSHYLDRPDGRIAYDDSGGDGRFAVLVPGMGDTRASFRFLAPALAAAGYRVVTTDLRGTGESDATFASYTPEAMGDDVVALLDHLDAGPALLVGVSIAAAAVVWAATEVPQRVARLVLIRPYPAGMPIPLAQRVLGAVLLAGPWGPAGWGFAFRFFFATRPPADLDEYRAGLRAMLAEPGRLGALRAMSAASKDAANARMSQVTQPTLVVLGAADVGDPARDARLVAADVRGEVVLIDGAGHYPHVEYPDETVAVLRDFDRRTISA